MTNFVFKIREVQREGFIAWDAVEEGSEHIVQLHKDGYACAGQYPEIAAHLLADHGITVTLNYVAALGDKLDGLTWTFRRSSGLIVIHEIPRTVARLSGIIHSTSN